MKSEEYKLLDIIYDYAWKKNFNLDLFYKENKEMIDGAEFQDKELLVLKDLCTIKFEKGHKFETCIICFTELEEKESVIELPKCKHIYHYECLEPWVKKNNKCPICKNGIRISLLGKIHEKVVKIKNEENINIEPTTTSSGGEQEKLVSSEEENKEEKSIIGSDATVSDVTENKSEITMGESWL